MSIFKYLNALKISNIIVSIVFGIIFVASFFFTYGHHVEVSILYSQIDYFIKDIHILEKILDVHANDIIKKTLDSEVSTQDDIYMEKHNKKLVNYTLIIIGSLVSIGIILLLLLYKFTQLNNTYSPTEFIKHLLIHNGILILVVGICYFLFTFLFIKEYMSIDINKIKKNIIVNIKNKIKSNN